MRVLIGFVLLSAITACGSDSTAPSGTTFDVSTSGETFLPTFLDISVHDNVRWTFFVAADNLGHNILFKPHVAGAPADIPLEVRSGTRTLQFNTTGDFNYVCDLHGAMTGRVTVH